MIAGTTLADRYQLTNRIAVGGMGEVWSALDQVLGREVAVKVLRPEYVDDAEFRERFRAEARHAAGLSHPGIASVYDFGEQTDPEPAAWLVMELVDGEPLSALLRRSPQLPTGQALDIVGQAALALGAAHEAGVVHRDVKPGNLLVRPDGVVKVTDFGIARAVDAVSVTRTGTLVGTAHYLSPEQAGGRPVLPASDVYSLGLVAYECLAGVRPFPVDNPVAAATAHLTQTPPPLPQTVPAEVRALVMRTLAKDPAERPAHAGELGRQALALRTGMTAPATAEVTTVLASAAADPTRMLTMAQPAPAAASTLLPPRPGATRRPAGQQHRRFVRLASAALGVVLLGVGLSNCVGADGSRSTAAPASRTPSASAVPRVAVNNADYAGRAPAGVQALLADRGLRSRLVYDGRGTPAGTVATVTPTGSLPLASTVVVHVVPVKTDEEDRDERGKGKGRGKDDD